MIASNISVKTGKRQIPDLTTYRNTVCIKWISVYNTAENRLFCRIFDITWKIYSKHFPLSTLSSWRSSYNANNITDGAGFERTPPVNGLWKNMRYSGASFLLMLPSKKQNIKWTKYMLLVQASEYIRQCTELIKNDFKNLETPLITIMVEHEDFYE